MDEERKIQILKSFDRFAGGRSLTAIWESETLKGREKHVLLYFGHSANFQKGGFVDLKPHKLETIAKKMGVSVDTVRRSLDILEKSGYVTIVYRNGPSGVQIANEYAMTFKIFDEYETKYVEKKLTEHTESEGGGSQIARVPLQIARVVPSQIARVGSQTASLIIDPLNSSPSSSSLSEKPRERFSRRAMRGKIPLTVLDGALAEQYDGRTKRDAIKSCVRRMLEKAPSEVVLAVIEKYADRPIKTWGSGMTTAWLNAVEEYLHPPQTPIPTDTDVFHEEHEEIQEARETQPKSLDICPF